MNKRILDLAVKSGHIVGELPLNANEKIQLAGLEKFAELIVRECDRYVAEHFDECEPWMSPGDLLKHFGVEK